MRDSFVVKIHQDGSQQFLYQDDHVLYQGQNLDVRRASNVTFDATAQQWFVINPDGSKLIDKGFDKRVDAIAAEISELEKRAASW